MATVVALHLSRVTERERLGQEAVRAAPQAREDPQRDQVDEPMEPPEELLFVPHHPPKWTWRPEFDVAAPEPNIDMNDEPMGEQQDQSSRRVRHKRPAAADEQEDQEELAQPDKYALDIPVQEVYLVTGDVLQG